MKKAFLLLLTVVLMIGLSSIVMAKVVLLDPEYSEKDQGVYGGTLISTQIGDPKTFNPLIAKETSSTDIIDNYVFEGLTGADGVTTGIIPELATSWDISTDGMVWTFHLRRGVQWSDGVEFTADDVVFTFNVIYDESIPTSSRDVLTIDGETIKVEKLNKYTVRLTLPQPYAPLLRNLPDIIPKHKLYQPWQNGTFNQTWGIDTEPSEIVGTGPYTIAEYRPGQRIIMLRNSKHWKRSPDNKPIPYITRWVREITESMETQTLKFENKDTHFTFLQAIDYQRMKAGEKTGNYTIIDGGPTFTTNFIVFNQNPDNPRLAEEPWRYEWYTNLHFRRAVAYAVDKETIIKQVFAGMATPQWSPVSTPNKVFLNENVKKYPYDLEKARAELKAGGFSWNQAGQLIDRNGQAVEFNFNTNAGNTQREAILTIVSNDLEKLGMQVNAQPIDFNKLVSQLTSEFDWDCIMIGLTGGVEPNGGANVWRSSGHLHMWNPVQEEPATDWEARIDELFTLGATTVPTDQRKVYYDEWQEIVAEQLPFIYTVAPNLLRAVRNTLHNTEVTAYGDEIGGAVTWNIYELYLSK